MKNITISIMIGVMIIFGYICMGNIILLLNKPSTSHSNKTINPDYTLELKNDSVYIYSPSDDKIIKCLFEDLEETINNDNL